MVAAASVSHGRQRESVHCPRWCVLLRLASASGKQIRDRGRRCRGRGSVYDDDGGPAPVRRMRSSMRQIRCGGRVRQCRRGGARRLRCRGEVYFAVGIENGEYSGVLLWVPGWGWLGRVNLKLRKQPPTKRHPPVSYTHLTLPTIYSV